MVERIYVTDPKLREREEKAIADLRALAPDGSTAGIDNKDKALGKRLSKLYKALGYEKRGDMIEAWGFTTGGVGGRPRSVDPAALVDELAALFAEREPADSLEAIAAEFPEFGSKMRTVERYAAEVFGRGLADELRARGVLRCRAGLDASGDAEIIAMVERFRVLYADANDKPKTIKELFDAHAEYKHLARMFSDMSERLFGEKPKRYLQSIGVLEANVSAAVDPDELKAVLEDVSQRIVGMDSSKAPATISALIALFPEHEAVLSSAKACGAVTKKSLQRRGILRKSDRQKKAERNKLLDRTARNASVEELSRLWRSLSLPDVIGEASVDSGLLPGGISSVEVSKGIEVKKDVYSHVSSLCYDEGANNVGPVPEGELRVRVRRMNWDTRYPYCEKMGDTGKTVPQGSRFYGRDATVVAVSEFEGHALVQAEVREVRPLRPETLLYGLLKAGALTANDFTLSDDWRRRYADVLL